VTEDGRTDRRNTNLERVREIMRLADGMRVDELVTLFADDAVMELPFAPGKMPRRHEGKQAIADFQMFARESFRDFSMTVDAIHETGDPHVVIAEHRSDAVVAANGRPYRNHYVTFFTFDDEGLIIGWREFYDAGVVVRAFRAEPATK
jgi:ketosteroid isomerase-like protein